MNPAQPDSPVHPEPVERPDPRVHRANLDPQDSAERTGSPEPPAAGENPVWPDLMVSIFAVFKTREVKIPT